MVAPGNAALGCHGIRIATAPSATWSRLSAAPPCRPRRRPRTRFPPHRSRDSRKRCMFNHFRKELDWGGRKLVLETGKVARQADGAVMARLGDTIVLCTAVGVKTAKPGQDFFPLTVNYQEKAFAAGKIPGGFFKREGRPSEKETLVSRLIDRPIRPLFPEGFRNEVQVVATVLSPRHGERPGHRGRHDRLLRRADAVRHPVLRPGRRRPRRLHRRRLRAEPHARPDEGLPARPGGRRHRRGRADGGVRGA